MGEFSAIYGAAGGPFESFFDAVVTSFFIDTAPNIIEVGISNPDIEKGQLMGGGHDWGDNVSISPTNTISYACDSFCVILKPNTIPRLNFRGSMLPPSSHEKPKPTQYVATIRRTLRMGGVWINCGPLQWHSTAALALSLDEMLALVAGSGFRLETVERLAPCGYRMEEGERSLRVDEFRPVFWVAVLEGRRQE